MLRDNSNYKCPECGTEGDHEHPARGVRQCSECGHVAGEAYFED